MREYGQIQSAFWHSTDCQEYGDQGKLLAAYLMCGPYTSGLGCFRLTDSNLAEDLGWTPQTVEETFSELSRNGFAYRSEKVVLLPKFLYWNKIANPNMAKARFAEWEQVPKGAIKAFAADFMLRYGAHWSEAQKMALQLASGTVTETIAERFGKQEQTKPNQTISNQDQNNIPQNDEKPSPPSKPRIKPVPERFEEFWNLCPRKVGKGDGVKAFAKLTAEEVIQAMEAMPKHAQRWKLLGTEDQFIPHPSRWLNDKRFLDVLTPIQGKRQEPPKQSRQAAIAETLLRDPRYAHTAARQSGLALPHGGGGVVDADAVIATVSARRRYDPGDGDGLD